MRSIERVAVRWGEVAVHVGGSLTARDHVLETRMLVSFVTTAYLDRTTIAPKAILQQARQFAIPVRHKLPL